MSIGVAAQGIAIAAMGAVVALGAWRASRREHISRTASVHFPRDSEDDRQARLRWLAVTLHVAVAVGCLIVIIGLASLVVGLSR